MVTIKDHYLREKDPERLQGLKKIKIIRTNLLPGINNLYLQLKNSWFRKKFQENIFEKNLIESTPAFDKENVEEDEKLNQRIKRYVISLLLALPDSNRNWIIPATFHAVREIKREKINCVITTSPPVSVNLIGLLVKIITGVKWVADFRDPWLNEAGNKRLHPTCALSLKIERYLEKKVLQKADSVLTTTEKLRDRYREQYNNLPKDKFITVYNGFDENAFSGLSNLRKYKKFTLTYAGTLYLGRTPQPVFIAIKNLIEQDKISQEKICIKLIGNCDNIDGCSTSEMIHSYGLDTVVEVLKPVPYSKVLEIISKSHIALLFAPNQAMQIPAKLYDYIGAGIPVLALADPGATASLINTKKIGKAFEPDDVKGIADFLLQAVTHADSALFDINEVREEFEIKSITKYLDTHLNALVFPPD